jgi:flavin reductase (DIM6/NTAB) family NADH-FMN oxidoreductase RutF
MNESSKKKLLLLIPHALYILTAKNKNNFIASSISWLTQVSFHPPLIVVALKKETQTAVLVQKNKQFVINFPQKNQKKIVQKFFKHITNEGAMLAEEPYLLSPILALPFFKHMAGFLECQVIEKINRGDHIVFVSEVIEAVDFEAPASPLLLSETPWKYGG